MALTFDGVSDILFQSVGSVTAIGALTVAVAMRINEDVERAGFFLLSTSADGFLSQLERRGSGNTNPLALGLGSDFATGSDPAVTFTVSDSWCVVAATKAAGTVAPRFHKVPIVSGSAVHSGSSATIGNSAGTQSKIRWANFGDGDINQFTQGDFICGGWWNSVLTDLNVESLATGLAAWPALSPAAFWVFDSVSSINDYVGTANETSRVGTTVSPSPHPFGAVPKNSRTAIGASNKRASFF